MRYLLGILAAIVGAGAWGAAATWMGVPSTVIGVGAAIIGALAIGAAHNIA